MQKRSAYEVFLILSRNDVRETKTCLIENISITEILPLLPPGGVVLAVDSADVVDVRVLVEEVTSVSTNADYRLHERSHLLLRVFIPSRKFSKCLAVITLRHYLLISPQNVNAPRRSSSTEPATACNV